MQGWYDKGQRCADLINRSMTILARFVFARCTGAQFAYPTVREERWNFASKAQSRSKEAWPSFCDQVCLSGWHPPSMRMPRTALRVLHARSSLQILNHRQLSGLRFVEMVPFLRG